MRKWNGILSAVILILFLIHGILGGFQLLGSGHVISKMLSHTLLTLIMVHVLFGIILTVLLPEVLGYAGLIAGVTAILTGIVFLAACNVRTSCCYERRNNNNNCGC